MMRNVMMALGLTSLAACGSVATLGSTSDEGGSSDGDAGKDDDNRDDNEASPTVMLLPSSVRDERGDTIDFASGQPVHTHAGAEVALTASGCAAVYKYGYLMDATVPFGEETAANPLAWNFTITDADLDEAASAFRIRTDGGAVLVDWTRLPAPDGGGVRTLEITRGGGGAAVPLLATRSGAFLVDVRARDRSGNETASSWCWDHHALQAPVSVSPFEAAEIAQWSFANRAPVSRLLRGTQATRMRTQSIVQYTAEPIELAWAGGGPRLHYTNVWLRDHVVESYDTPAPCTSAPCPGNVPPAVFTTRIHGDGIVRAPLGLALIDDTTGATIASSATLDLTAVVPARAPGAPPRRYTLVLSLGAVADLGVIDGSGAYGEYSHTTQHYTGRPMRVVTDICAADGTGCTFYVRYSLVEALERLAFEIDTFSLVPMAKASQTAAYAMPHVPSAEMSLSLRWSSFDADIPGDRH